MNQIGNSPIFLIMEGQKESELSEKQILAEIFN